MLRGTITLLSRSIRADAQQRMPHAFRIGSVVFILILLVSAHVHAAESEVSAPGLQFFQYLAYLLIALITLAGMGHFANAITEEKEEGTLGLLLLADISPLSILLGKSTNRILSAWLIFLAQFPFALLALTLGGITVLQIVQVYISLAAYLFLIANLALLVSVLCQRTGEALAAMGVLSVLLHGFFPWLSYVTGRLIISDYLPLRSSVGEFVNGLLAFHEETSVVFEVQKILDPTKHADLLSVQMFSNFWLGILCFGFAWLSFRRIVWAPDASSPSRSTMPSATSRLISFIPRPWVHALIWKDFHFLAGGPFVFMLKSVLYPVFIAISYLYAGIVESAAGMPISLFVRQSVLVVLIVELMIYSSGLFHSEKKWGTLPTLLMLPKTVAYLGYSKVLGCLLGSIPTLVAYVAVVLTDPGNGQTGHGVLISWETLITLCVILVLCQLTILCSLIVKWGALPLAVGLLLIIGGIAFPVLLAVMSLLSEGGGYKDDYVKLGPIIYTTAMISAALQLETGRRIHLAASS